MKIEVVPAQLNRWNVSLARKSNLKLIHNWKIFEFQFVSIPLLRFSLLDSGNGVVHVHAKIESAPTSSKTNLESSSTLHFVESLNKKMFGCLFLLCFVQLQKSPFNFFLFTAFPLIRPDPNNFVILNKGFWVVLLLELAAVRNNLIWFSMNRLSSMAERIKTSLKTCPCGLVSVPVIRV